MFQQQERMIAACFVGTLLALAAPAAQAQAPSGSRSLKEARALLDTLVNATSASFTSASCLVRGIKQRQDETKIRGLRVNCRWA
jgi:hypothetical protein